MIANMNRYNESMKKSLLDKAFFVQHVNTDIYIDFGCADGTLLEFLNTLNGTPRYIGYDISQEMIDIAKDNNSNVEYCCDTLHHFKKIIQGLKGTKTLILSSVIHEVYSYGTEESVKEFWDFVYSDIFDNIVIRDLMLDVSTQRKSDINDVLKVIHHPLLNEFQEIWGSVENQKNLLHFLSKYRYTCNWKREARENYYPITRTELLKSIPTKYIIVMEGHYALPFFKDIVKKDFDITIKDNTHIKLIIRRK